jgi:hypothetical protein
MAQYSTSSIYEFRIGLDVKQMWSLVTGFLKINTCWHKQKDATHNPVKSKAKQERRI